MLLPASRLLVTSIWLLALVPAAACGSSADGATSGGVSSTSSAGAAGSPAATMNQAMAAAGAAAGGAAANGGGGAGAEPVGEAGAGVTPGPVGGTGGAAEGGTGNGSSSPLPPPPNDLDPGDGTLATGGALVLGGTTYRTVASTTGCAQQASTNRFEAVVSNFNEPFQVFTVRVTMPQDQLNASRVFNVGPHPEDQDFGSLGHASVRVFTPDGAVHHGSSGQVWVELDEASIATVRAQGVQLSSGQPSVSFALRCDEAVEG